MRDMDMDMVMLMDVVDQNPRMWIHIPHIPLFAVRTADSSTVGG